MIFRGPVIDLQLRTGHGRTTQQSIQKVTGRFFQPRFGGFGSFQHGVVCVIQKGKGRLFDLWSLESGSRVCGLVGTGHSFDHQEELLRRLRGR